MKISCCVFDMDGTLLTSENKISEVDKKTLIDLNNKGVTIALATGRSHLQVLEYVDQLGISSPIITCNGARIINTVTGEIISDRFITPEDAKALIAYAKENNLEYLMYTADCLYFTENGNRYKFYMAYNETAPAKYKLPIRLVSEYPEDSDYSDILKILYYDDISTIPALEERFNKNNNLSFTSSFGRLIEIMYSDTSKGNALKVLAEHLNIPISEVVAFGDNENDRSMFEAAGFSVAMGNAKDNIKSIVDFVTKSNNEYGITYALDYIINKI